MPFAVQNSVKLNMPRLNMAIDRERASALGITAATIEQALALAYAGGYVTQFTTDQDQYQVIPEIEKVASARAGDLGLLYLRSPLTGSLVPLKSLVTWKEEAVAAEYAACPAAGVRHHFLQPVPGRAARICHQGHRGKSRCRSCRPGSPASSPVTRLSSRNPSPAWAFCC